MTWEERQGVKINTINTHLSIQLGEHKVSQARPLLEAWEEIWVDEIKGEMNKIKPRAFDGENMNDEEAESWLLGMRKYFQLHNYSS
jgi:hypothetical protein